ncbi:MAG: DUF456 domain-containing protein [Acidobacteria bacterium]|nr:DUF456 domain-containing protein [Acidobacteriota bacterium]
MKIALWVLAVLLVFGGIAGTFLPVLAGAPLVLAGLVLAAWIEEFEKVGAITLIVLGILALLAVGFDFLASTLGAKRVGASRSAIIGAMLGTLVGLFFGLPGIVLGPFLGAAIGEFIERREWLQAGKVGLGTWLGMVFGLAGKVALVFTMIGIFIAAYFL